MQLPVKQYWRLLVSYLRAQRGRVALLLLLLLGTIGLELLNPQILRYFIDTAKADSPPGTLMWAALFFIAIALLQQGVAVGAAYCSESVAWTATNALRVDLAQHALNLDMRFHNQRTPGEFIERIDEDVTALANFFSQFVIIVAGNALLVIGVLLLLFHEHWSVGLLVTVFALLALVTMNYVRDRTTRHWVPARKASADLSGYVEERLAGLDDIRASGATGYKMRLLYGHMRTLTDRYRSALVLGSLGPIAASGLYAFALVGALGLGAYWYYRGEMTLGTVFLLGFYVRQIERPIRNIMNQIEDLQRAGASIERVEELLSARSAVADGPGALLPQGALPVEFDAVSFEYHTDYAVLCDVSFRLEAGEVLGLLGRTGSGKTTITRLLFRLYDPTAGTIRLGHVDVRQPTLEQLRERIGMVTQDVQLFRGTVRDNLTFFNPEVPDTAIAHAIGELGLDSWYRSLPHGLDTPIGSGGSTLSAGEAQLLAFTRVFLHDPGLVILDEASSRLDPATEQLIERAVDRLLQGRTGIIVAHRLATVERADQIMILEHGRIVEHGTYTALASRPDSRFAQLQRLGLEEALS